MLKTLLDNLRKSFLFLFIIFSTSSSVFGQIIVGQPTFKFSPVCASPAFNEYEINFNFLSDGKLLSSNQFILELSAPDGSFSPNASVVYTSEVGEITTSPGNITFAFPISIGGEHYRLRIKSTAPAVTGQPSVEFPAYYKIHNSQYTLNNFIPVATYCAGSNYVLTIDKPGSSLNNSPLKYPNLTYNWYKDNGLNLPPTLVSSSAGGSYIVTEPGLYYTVTNYGACSSSANSYSNKVTVSESTTDGGNLTITSSLGSSFCQNGESTILSVSSGNSYQWFKDGVEIPDAKNQTYSTNSAGLYSVRVDFGGCTGIGSINLESEELTASISPEGNSFINMDAGESLEVAVVSYDLDLSYKWYLDGKIIPDAVGNNYLVKNKGNYKVKVSQTTGCITVKEFNFQVFDSNLKIDKIPNIVSLSSAQYNVWDIPYLYKNADTNVMIVSSQGDIVFNGTDYDPSKWEIKSFKSINPVYYYIITKGTEEKKDL